jgi:hypothetical protein
MSSISVAFALGISLLGLCDIMNVFSFIHIAIPFHSHFRRSFILPLPSRHTTFHVPDLCLGFFLSFLEHSLLLLPKIAVLCWWLLWLLRIPLLFLRTKGEAGCELSYFTVIFLKLLCRLKIMVQEKWYQKILKNDKKT